MALEFLESEKNKRMLVYKGYLYHMERKTEQKEIWRCCDRSCKGRCHTANGEMLKLPSQHSHAASTGQLEKARVQSTIKRRANETEEPARVIVQSAVENLSPAGQASVPKTETTKRNIRRYRQLPPQVDDNLPAELRITLNGLPFLRHDIDFLLFAADEDLQFLSGCRVWFADGTFKVSPAGYTQLYTIHGTRDGINIPCVFALLCNKLEVTYAALLTKLGEIEPRLQPQTVITDFEQAAMNAFTNVFSPQIHGCHFHFGQCIWRKVQEYGYAGRYNNEPDYAMHIRMLVALAYDPNDDKVRVYEELIDLDSFPEVDQLLNYFEDTFIGRRRRRRRGGALFSSDIWDCYQAVRDDIPRTNNAVEGWHNAFARTVQIAHPTLPRLVVKLQKEQNINQMNVERMLAGEDPPLRKKKYRDLDRRLRTVVLDYENRTSIDYLRGCSHNINLMD